MKSAWGKYPADLTIKLTDIVYTISRCRYCVAGTNSINKFHFRITLNYLRLRINVPRPCEREEKRRRRLIFVKSVVRTYRRRHDVARRRRDLLTGKMRWFVRGWVGEGRFAPCTHGVVRLLINEVKIDRKRFTNKTNRNLFYRFLKRFLLAFGFCGVWYLLRMKIKEYRVLFSSIYRWNFDGSIALNHRTGVITIAK